VRENSSGFSQPQRTESEQDDQCRLIEVEEQNAAALDLQRRPSTKVLTDPREQQVQGNVAGERLPAGEPTADGAGPFPGRGGGPRHLMQDSDEVYHLRQRAVDARAAVFDAVQGYERQPGQKATRQLDEAIALVDQLQQQLDEAEEQCQLQRRP